MLLGLKYCGGCNPRYDRTALVARLKAALPEVEFQPVRPGTVYDLLLVVSGCHVECADIEGIEARLGRIGVFAAEHLEPAIEKIKAYSEQ